MVLLLTLPLVVYGLRLLINDQFDEVGYWLGRTEMSLGIFATFVWLCLSTVDTRQAYRYLLIGYMLLCVPMIYVGVTGQRLLEEARPTRNYGFYDPFFKAAGVPRSYGELAILSSAALAYLLVYRHTTRRLPWVIAMGTFVISLLVAQSRTGFLAAFVVLACYLGLRSPARVTVARVSVLTAILFPLAVQFVDLSSIKYGPLSGFFSDRTLELNAQQRISMDSLAISHLLQFDLSGIFFGYSRADWLLDISSLIGRPQVLHNMFLSTLLYFGWVAGSVVLIAFFLAPIFAIARRGLHRQADVCAFLSAVGMIVSLQFYEGFFSLIVMLEIAVLWYVAYVRHEGPSIVSVQVPDRGV